MTAALSTTTEMYYADKVASLGRIFGARDVRVEPGRVVLDGRAYPVLDDVIVTLPPDRWPQAVRERLAPGEAGRDFAPDFAEDIQFTFGEEWKTFSSVEPDHEATFRQYFDLVDLPGLRDSRVCDLGCGMGRWSWFVSQYCREIVLADFSEAIFVARRNLRERSNAIFVMADIRRLPFAHDFADFLFCLGVLHHLPTPALDEVAALRPYARRLLIYLYYALDNRPLHYRLLLSLVTPVRLALSRVRSGGARDVVTLLLALGVYRPLVGLGRLLRPVGLAEHVPLYEGYHGKTLKVIRQDVYDRFFTRIEQRVSRRQIEGLRGVFSSVRVSPEFPYWHFLCER
jgi:SAM-dependent methyltransferase